MKKENGIILSYNANIHTHKLKRIVGYYYKEYVHLYNSVLCIECVSTYVQI